MSAQDNLNITEKEEVNEIEAIVDRRGDAGAGGILGYHYKRNSSR
jgi:hypothetical protein